MAISQPGHGNLIFVAIVREEGRQALLLIKTTPPPGSNPCGSEIYHVACRVAVTGCHMLCLPPAPRRKHNVPKSLPSFIHNISRHSTIWRLLMDPVPCTLGDATDKFFESHRPVTRQQCDSGALSLVGEPIYPVPIQGPCSYTVTAGAEQSTMVQFRGPSSDFDPEVLNLARKSMDNWWRLILVMARWVNRHRSLCT